MSAVMDVRYLEHFHHCTSSHMKWHCNGYSCYQDKRVPAAHSDKMTLILCVGQHDLKTLDVEGEAQDKACSR